MTRMRGGALALTLALSVGACGGEPSVPRDLAAEMNAQIDDIEQTAAAGDYAGARTRAGSLRSTVVDLQAAGRLDDATAARVLDAVAALDSALETSATSSGATSSSVTAPTTASTRVPATTATTKRKPPGKEEKDD